jgi:hypothetical protein
VPADRTRRRHPASALLVIEVAVTSLAIDLGRKAALYAAADVPEYWVVDVPGKRCTSLAVRARLPGQNFAGAHERIRPTRLPVGHLDLAVLPA